MDVHKVGHVTIEGVSAQGNGQDGQFWGIFGIICTHFSMWGAIFNQKTLQDEQSYLARSCYAA